MGLVLLVALLGTRSIAAGVVHRVERGDSLNLLALAYYGSPARAREIAQDNGIKDPDRIRIGARIRLRKDAEASQAIRSERLLRHFRRKFGSPEAPESSARVRPLVPGGPAPPSSAPLPRLVLPSSVQAPAAPSPVPAITIEQVQAKSEEAAGSETYAAVVREQEGEKKETKVADYESLVAEAKAALEGGRLDDAVRAAERAVELDPDRPAAWIFRIRALVKLDRKADASRSARELVSRRPELARLPLLKGLIE